jgi:integrase
MGEQRDSRTSRRVKLTRAFVERVMQGKEEPGPWTDSASPLRLKGTLGGASYSVMRKVGGKVRIFTPTDDKGVPIKNSAGVLTLDQARDWAAGVVGRLATGQAPIPERKAETPTFDARAAEYLVEHAKTHAPASTHAETQGARYAGRVLGAKRLAEISAADARRLKDAFAESPSSARKAWGAAKRVMDYAVARGDVDANVFKAMSAPKPPPARGRYPRLPDLVAIWRACDRTAGTGADIIQFAIAMPLRAGTITSLTWGEVLIEQAELRLLPRDGRKFKGEQRLPLTTLAVELLRRRMPKTPNAAALVFGSDSKQNPGGPFSGWSKAVRRLQARAGVADWSVHDFRRSAVSEVAEHRPDVSEGALDRWLTHAASSTNSGVKAVYQRASGFRGMRQAADAWDELLRAGLADNVVQLHRPAPRTAAAI